MTKMADMTEKEYRPVLIGGRMISVCKPTDGQFEALARIAHTIARGTDDDKTEFWMKQINRLGTLMESLIMPSEVDLVDELVLTGKTTTAAMLSAILGAWTEDKADKPVKAKAAPARVQRK